MSKKQKYNCEKCKDEGYWSNPFDQEFKCDCKKKKYKRPDYRGLVLHIKKLTEIHDNIAISMNDLYRWAKAFNCPIPKEYKDRFK